MRVYDIYLCVVDNVTVSSIWYVWLDCRDCAYTGIGRMAVQIGRATFHVAI